MRHRFPSAFLGAALIVTVAACDAEAPKTPSTDDLSAEATPEATLSQAVAPPVTGQPAFTRTVDDPRVEWNPCPFDWMPEGCEIAIVQGLDPQGLNADAFFKIEPGSTVPEHYHTSAERMVLLSGVMEVDYEGQAPVRVVPGAYAYGPAGLPHETHCLEEGGERCILFIAFEDPVDAIEGRPEEIPGQSAFTRTPQDAEVQWGPCPGFMPEGCELALIQALDPGGLNADALFKLDPGTTVPMHWHTSAERMVLISGEMRVNYQGQPPVTFGPFTYAYGPAGLPHETRCGEGEVCILFIAFEDPVDAIDVRGGTLPHRP